MVLIHCDVGKIDTTPMEEKFANICQHLDFFLPFDLNLLF